MNTDPIFGTGFMSFWDDKEYQEKLPSWVAHSAHNGYLEIYLAGGFLGLTALAVMLLGLGGRLISGLSGGGDYAVMRFAIFLMLLIANFSESNFACMTPEGFLFLIAAIGYAGNHWVLQIEQSARTGAGGPIGRSGRRRDGRGRSGRFLTQTIPILIEQFLSPARIIQDRQEPELPLAARASAAGLKALNPGFEYLYFDDADVVAFVRKEFPGASGNFRELSCTASRSDDFFPLPGHCYRLGGFYFDLDMFMAAGLEELLPRSCVFPFEQLTMKPLPSAAIRHGLGNRQLRLRRGGGASVPRRRDRELRPGPTPPVGSGSNP